MTLRVLKQINYKQKDTYHNQEVSWEDHYFNENEQNIKVSQENACQLMQKRKFILFNHKFIQEKFVADYIFNLLEKIFMNDEIDEKLLRKSLFCNRDKFNISLEHFSGCLQLLKLKLQQLDQMKEKLIEIIILQNKYSCSKEELVRSISNSIYMLSCLGELLEEEDFSEIQISDTNQQVYHFLKVIQVQQSLKMFQKILAILLKQGQKMLIGTIQIVRIASQIDHKNQVNSIIFIEDGIQLIFGSNDGTIKLWDITKNVMLNERKFQNQKILKLLYSQIEITLTCLTIDQIFLLNAKNFSNTIYQSLINDNNQEILLSSNQKYLEFQNSKNSLSILEVENLKKAELQTTKFNILKFKYYKMHGFILRLKLLITGGQAVLLQNVFDLSNVSIIASVPTISNNTSCVLFSQNFIIIEVGNDDGIIEIWKIINLLNFDLIQSINLDESIEKMNFQKIINYQQSIYYLYYPNMNRMI